MQHKYKVGDKLEVTEAKDWSNVEVGDIVTVQRLHSAEELYWMEKPHDHINFTRDMLKEVETEQEVEKELKFKVGDKVKRVKDVYHGMVAGDISTVVRTGTGPYGTGGIDLDGFGEYQ